jgi:hypothetical protein
MPRGGGKPYFVLKQQQRARQQLRLSVKDRPSHWLQLLKALPCLEVMR